LTKIEDLRTNYLKGTLEEKDLPSDPMVLFHQWWNEVLLSEIPEPNAMTLATVNKEGKPSARIVLLKGASALGFEFYTNYQSAKAKDLDQNPHVALVFLWKEIERQVRIEGIVEKVTYEQSQNYFQSRPRGSQIGAWASPQSTIIPDRKFLEEAADKISEQFENVDPLPCPEQWGGYMIMPTKFEFWQGRSDRMHDRICYSKKEKDWKKERLAP
jgi:pyridoxamine 5'-phosphate oxidase